MSLKIIWHSQGSAQSEQIVKHDCETGLTKMITNKVLFLSFEYPLTAACD